MPGVADRKHLECSIRPYLDDREAAVSDVESSPGLGVYAEGLHYEVADAVADQDIVLVGSLGRDKIDAKAWFSYASDASNASGWTSFIASVRFVHGRHARKVGQSC